MAVGKSSMARAAKSGTKSKSTGKSGAKAAKTAKAEAPAVKETVNEAVKAPVAETAVIAAPSEDVMKKVVYQKSSQVLDRDAKPGETFGVGDAVPIYFL